MKKKLIIIFITTISLLLIKPHIYASNEKKTDITFNKEDQKISIKAYKASLKEVLNEISIQTEVEIYFDPAIEKEISINLKERELEDAIKQLIRPISNAFTFSRITFKDNSYKHILNKVYIFKGDKSKATLRLGKNKRRNKTNKYRKKSSFNIDEMLRKMEIKERENNKKGNKFRATLRLRKRKRDRGKNDPNNLNEIDQEAIDGILKEMLLQEKRDKEEYESLMQRLNADKKFLPNQQNDNERILKRIERNKKRSISIRAKNEKEIEEIINREEIRTNRKKEVMDKLKKKEED